MPKSKPDAFLYPYAWDDFNRLPGNVRRQITIAINALAKNPRPSASKQLDIPGETMEVRRFSMGHWRIIYTMENEQAMIITIRRRPPYDYEDLENLLKGL